MEKSLSKAFQLHPVHLFLFAKIHPQDPYAHSKLSDVDLVEFSINSLEMGSFT